VSSLPRPSQKDKILRAALECFAELGYDATRVRHVAERAGVSEAALYRHYPSMQALAQELYTQHFAAFAAQLDEATSAGTTEERLRRAVRTTLASYRAEPAAFTFALLRMPTFLPNLPTGSSYPIEILEHVIAAGQRRREVRAGQPNLLAAIFLGCVLRPIILAGLAAPGALDLMGPSEHDRVIEDAAIAALKSAPAGGEKAQRHNHPSYPEEQRWKSTRLSGSRSAASRSGCVFAVRTGPTRCCC
jgi:AcrR family transcriptional regulator